jgi:hypothetical protein
MRDTIEMAREAGFYAMRGHGLLPHVPEDIFIANVGVTEEVNRLVELARADERERMYGKDIDTLLFEEHRLGFEKGSRSEREVCAKVCENIERNGHWITKAEAAEAIRARGETKCTN